jgi:hypothetical protein
MQESPTQAKCRWWAASVRVFRRSNLVRAHVLAFVIDNEAEYLALRFWCAEPCSRDGNDRLWQSDAILQIVLKSF